MQKDYLAEPSPLRKCSKCGKEAHTLEDLELFTKDKTCKYGVLNVCKDCTNAKLRAKHVPKPRVLKAYRTCSICGLTLTSEESLIHFHPRRSVCKDCVSAYYYLYHNKGATLEDYIKSKEKPLYLKKCPKCGLEAHTESDLILFAKKDEGICKKCKNIREKSYSKPRGKVLPYTTSLKEVLSSYSYFLSKDKNMPKNISDSDFNRLLVLKEQAYYLSKICNTVYEIDHIYPRNHPLFCGLTVPDNMQLLDKRSNMSKSNHLGYRGQSNISSLKNIIPYKIERRALYNLLGSNMSWDDFISYEKLNFGGYL